MFLKTYLSALAPRSPYTISVSKYLNQEGSTLCIKGYIYLKFTTILNQTLLKLGNRSF